MSKTEKKVTKVEDEKDVAVTNPDEKVTAEVATEVDSSVDEKPAEDAQDDSESIDQLRDEVSKAEEKAEEKVVNAADKAFEKRRVHRASKEERKELYKSEHVYTGRGSDIPVETTSTKKKAEYNELMISARAIPLPKILKGVIVGMKELPTFGVCATVNLNGFLGFYSIYIPAKMLVLRETKADPEKDREDIIRIIQNRICTEINFVVYDVNETEMFAIGSRLRAMEIEGRQNYVKELSDGLPRVFPGKIVQGIITETRKNGMWVESMGAECFISASDISHNIVREVNEKYEVGEAVNFKVLEIGSKEVVYGNKKLNLVTIKGSIKEAEDDPKDLWYDSFDINDVSQGEISMLYEKGVLVNLQGKMDCMCFYPNFTKNLTKGQMVVVRITEKKDETKQLSGMITRALDF